MTQTQLVIFDTEFTAWQGSMGRGWSLDWEEKELIQLAAVKVEINEDAARVVESFNEIIRPVINPQLSDYITDLTGISQDMIDQMGIDFPSALVAFHRFTDMGTLACYAWGDDGAILADNSRLQNISMPDFSAGMFNLRDLSREWGFELTHLCSGELAAHYQLRLEGHPHNALFDVRSIALMLNHWLTHSDITRQQLIER